MEETVSHGPTFLQHHDKELSCDSFGIYIDVRSIIVKKRVILVVLKHIPQEFFTFQGE